MTRPISQQTESSARLNWRMGLVRFHVSIVIIVTYHNTAWYGQCTTELCLITSLSRGGHSMSEQ